MLTDRDLVSIRTLHGTVSISQEQMAREILGVNHYTQTVADLLIDLNGLHELNAPLSEQLKLVKLAASESRRFYRSLSLNKQLFIDSADVY